MQEAEKKMKVKKGWLAVQVGVEEEEDCCSCSGSQRFVIPISFLYHPLFNRLLDKAYEVYGYQTAGPLRLPCSVDDFLSLLRQIEKESGRGRAHHHYNQHSRNHLPFHSSSN
ncbi:auxin-responsive protein SAUR32-like [Carica papaya]|uniref:auxin-responsive protein SAUR32-like n=1 Tax=Carica papaya TaxID=3649 RepID=UPI000B8CF0DE|nr:auxin-responsive protein SAUR32-like [Carica papaya]